MMIWSLIQFEVQIPNFIDYY